MQFFRPLPKFQKQIFLVLTVHWTLFCILFYFFQSFLVGFTALVSSFLSIYVLMKPIQLAMNTFKNEGIIREGNFDLLLDRFQSMKERLEKQEREFLDQKEEILESISEGILATDASIRVTFVNKSACKILGVTKEELLGKSLSVISSSLGTRCHEVILEALQTANTIRQSWADADNLCLLLVSAPFVYGTGALLLLQDKTSDHKMVEMGKAFIANASHELKTPITVIRGFAETLQDHPDLSKDLLCQISGKIVHTCERLDKLVKGLLTLAELEQRTTQAFENIDLHQIIENCRHEFCLHNPSVNLTIEKTDSLLAISAEPSLLELAILNILENAVRYSKSNPKIGLFIRAEEEMIYIDIHDSGIGIEQKDLPHIFDRFYTVDKGRSRKSGGSGLGLSIVKTILERHKGKVSADSVFGSGSVFTLSLPRIKSLQ